MKLMDARQFEILRKSMLRDFGRISSGDAHGFIIDLDVALERSGLKKPAIKWRGGDDGLFTATGKFEGQPTDSATLALEHLDDTVAYGDDVAVTLDVSPDAVHISLATWTPVIGLATIRIDVQRADSGDIPGH
jgi:hypothetical protein